LFFKEIKNRQQKIGGYREYVQKMQKKRAEDMLKATSSRYGVVDVGTTVRIPIDQVDRGKIDPRNVLGVVLENSDGYYQIGTQNGFKCCKTNLIKYI
jgi:hypothetical protein